MSSLFGLEQQQKQISQNPFRTRIFLFLTYLFRIETINSSYTPVAPLKTIPDSRPKRRKNPTLWKTGTYLHGLYRGVPPPPRVTATLRAPTWDGVGYFQITKTENIFKDSLP